MLFGNRKARTNIDTTVLLWLTIESIFFVGCCCRWNVLRQYLRHKNPRDILQKRHGEKINDNILRITWPTDYQNNFQFKRNKKKCMLMRWDAQKFRPDRERKNCIFYAPFWFWLILSYGLWFATVKYASIFFIREKDVKVTIRKVSIVLFMFLINIQTFSNQLNRHHEHIPDIYFAQNLLALFCLIETKPVFFYFFSEFKTISLYQQSSPFFFSDSSQDPNL